MKIVFSKNGDQLYVHIIASKNNELIVRTIKLKNDFSKIAIKENKDFLKEQKEKL
jgi:hypothetical protein